jgi:hypothetical protein
MRGVFTVIEVTRLASTTCKLEHSAGSTDKRRTFGGPPRRRLIHLMMEWRPFGRTYKV